MFCGEKALFKRNRVYRHSRAETISRVHRYFDKEESTGQLLNLKKDSYRLSEATCVRKTVVSRIKNEKDV